MRTGAPRHANYQLEHSSPPSAVTNCYCAHPSTTSHDLHVSFDGSSCSYGLFEVWSRSAIGEMLVQIYCFGIKIIQSTFCTKSQLKASLSTLHYQEENEMNQTEMSNWICWRRSVDKQQGLQGHRAPRPPGYVRVCAHSQLLEQVHRWRSGGEPTMQRTEHLPTWQITCDLWEMRQLFRPTLTCHRRLACSTPHWYIFRFSSVEWETENDLWPHVSLKIFMGFGANRVGHVTWQYLTVKVKIHI